MAQRGVQQEQERFSCYKCKRLPNVPVTTGCGHSFCRSCINNQWDQEEERGSFSCPQCGQTFTPRPVLERNTMIAALVDQLERVRLQDATARTERQRELGLQQPESESESEPEPEPESDPEPEPEPESENRAVFLRSKQELTLDPTTAHRYLLLSEGNRKVKCMKSSNQTHDDSPERFTKWCQVMSKELLEPRCYWEVEIGGVDVVGVAVTDENIRRAGNSDECRFGFYDNSWMLLCNGNCHAMVYKGLPRVTIPGPLPSRVGVYLDQGAGVLEFYRVVSDTMTLLRRVPITSTEPLYAGLWVSCHKSTAKFCELK